MNDVGQPESSAQGRPLRALIVDDNEALLVGFSRILSRAGYDVTTVSNAAAALEELERGTFDVLLSDIAMPGGMSGIQLLERLRAEGNDIPVVLATGDPRMETAVKALEHGAVRYLTKPVEPRILVGVVGEAVRVHGLARLKQLALDNDALRGLIDELDRARAGAQAASLARSEFLTKVSHELRTPLTAIAGFAELALDGELADETRVYVENIKRSSDVLHTLIGNVLDFADLDRGTLRLEATPFDLRDAAEDAVRPYADAARAKGLTVVQAIDASVPHAVHGDARRLRQILENLISNAVRFTRSGEVRVCAALEAPAGADLRVRVSVSDTGPGIPEEAVARVVEAFTQADDSSTRRHGGAGLGLTIASKLAELMGGKMTIDSAPGAGTTAHFTIPLGRASATRGVVR